MLERILLVVLLTITCAAIATAQTDALKNYYNAEYKVGFKYPANWKLGKENSKVDDEPGFTALADLDPAASSIRGQLKEAAGKLSVGQTDEAACKVYTIPITPDRDKPVATKVGRLTFYKMSGSDGAAGSIGYTDFYRIFHGGRCYELGFMKFQLNARDKDRYVREIEQQFNAILGSLYFGK